MSSALRRSTALSAGTVSAGKKNASRGERRGGEGESGRVGDWANLPSDIGLLLSDFFFLPSSFFLTSVTSVTESVAELPSAFFLLPSKRAQALTKLSISDSVFPKLIINVKCWGMGSSAVTAS